MREHHFSYCETVRKYNLESTRIGGAIQMLQWWERKYLEEGHIMNKQKAAGQSSAAFCTIYVFGITGYS